MRALLLDLAPDEVYNLAAISSVAQAWERPDLAARVNGLAAVGLLESALQVQDKTGRRVRVRAGLERRDLRRAGHQPAGRVDARCARSTRTARRRPTRTSWSASTAAATSTPRASCSTTTSRRGGRPQFVSRKITSTVAAIAQGRADGLALGNLDVRRDWGWAPDYVDAMVRAARADEADDFVVATGVGHSVREFVGAAFARVGIDDWADLVTVDPAFVRPVDPTDLTGDARRARERLGWAPTVAFEEIVGRMVDADLDPPPGGDR